MPLIKLPKKIIVDTGNYCKHYDKTLYEIFCKYETLVMKMKYSRKVEGSTMKKLIDDGGRKQKCSKSIIENILH